MAMKWRQYASVANTEKGIKIHYFENIEDIALKVDKGNISSHSGPLPSISEAPTTYSKSSAPARTVTHQHAWPLQPGWIVAYRDQFGMLRGGCDEFERAIVMECQFDGVVWKVRLLGGEEVDLRAIRSVAKTDDNGEVIAAWTVRECGYDGEKKYRAGPSRGP
jgi:hypothetical protein